MKSTYIVMINALLCTVSGEYFDDYCAKPIGTPHPGEIQGVLCVVKFPIISNDIAKAMSLCEENSPYNVRDAYAEGKKTVCKYERPNLKCDEGEAALDDRCVTVRGLGPFSKHKEGCGNKHQLHVLTDNNVWIWASEGDEAQGEQKQEEQDEDWRPVKIQTRTVYPYEAGTLFVADQSQLFPYLCSRPSMYYARGIENLISDARTLGFNVIEAKDRDGKTRPFLIYDNVFNVKTKSRFEVDYSDFKDVCNVFPNGYVASREDFYDQNEFMKVYENARIKLFRTTVGRHSSMKLEPSDSCSENIEMHKMLRKKFQFFSPNGAKGSSQFCEKGIADLSISWETVVTNSGDYIVRRGFSARNAVPVKEVPADHWGSGYPMNMCADTPRITAVMTPHGYRDMPAIARLPLICTFGTPPDLKTATDDDICNKAAHFDRSLNRCVCNNASADASVKEPGKWKGYPPGSVCLDCTLTKEEKTVVFILDQSGSVKNYWNKVWLRHCRDSGAASSTEEDIKPSFSHCALNKTWNFLWQDFNCVGDLLQMVAFVRRAFGYLWNSAKVGVVTFSTDATIEIPLDHYTNEYLQSAELKYNIGWTRLDLGMILAQKMLSKEPHDTVKDVIILSDGDTIAPGIEKVNWVKICQDVARDWSKNNGKIIYVEVGILSPHVNEILSVSPANKLIPISHFDALNDIFKDVMQELCTPRL